MHLLCDRKGTKNIMAMQIVDGTRDFKGEKMRDNALDQEDSLTSGEVEEGGR